MAPSPIRITGARITPVAFVDPPLLNTVGVHQPYALRAIIQLDTDAGLVGLGETYADSTHLARLDAAADAITGLDVFSLNAIHAAIADRLRGDNRAIGTAGMITTASAVDQVFSPFEVACLDIQGHATGRPVSDLLGGKVRDAVPFSAYLFYKWAAHPGHEPDTFGEALDPDGLVKQAKRIIDEYGFTAIKLKGGVFPPEEEMAAIEALHKAFPNHPLRLDPNAAWTPQTSIKVASGLAGILEYLEDPTPGLDGMAEVAQQSPMPLATNMCVVAFDQLKPAVAKGSVRVVLSDHHYWGGLQRSRLLAGICDTFGLGLSMHSNSHLGISLAAMVHLAGATPNLTYACDTHWPWKTEEIVKPGALAFKDGSVAVPTTPGLGIEIDDDALAALHEQYLTCGIRDRDDTGYMKTIDPGFEAAQPALVARRADRRPRRPQFHRRRPCSGTGIALCGPSSAFRGQSIAVAYPGIDVGGEPFGRDPSTSTDLHDRLRRAGGEHAVEDLVAAHRQRHEQSHDRAFGAQDCGAGVEGRGDVVDRSFGHLGSVPLGQIAPKARHGGAHDQHANGCRRQGNRGFP